MKSFSFPVKKHYDNAAKVEQSDSEVYLFDMNCASHVKVNGLFTSFPYIVHGYLFQAGVS